MEGLVGDEVHTQNRADKARSAMRKTSQMQRLKNIKIECD